MRNKSHKNKKSNFNINDKRKQRKTKFKTIFFPTKNKIK